MTESRQAALIAPTIRAARDRVPAVQAGGMRRVGRNKKPAYKVLFGSEFGARTYKQFKPHRGAEGYWFFPLVERDAQDISAAWSKAANDIVKEFGSDG
ncbi:hypothetical protein ACIA2T_19675 [Amycolatopsis japonica]|uniref:hypothetical protein n=1 Tax=Amycolatopsis japonica TaxID=208439 RepID=UPI00379D61DC